MRGVASLACAALRVKPQGSAFKGAFTLVHYGEVGGLAGARSVESRGDRSQHFVCHRIIVLSSKVTPT